MQTALRVETWAPLLITPHHIAFPQQLDRLRLPIRLWHV